MEVFQRLKVQRTRVELNSSLEFQSATESMAIHYGSLTVLSDVSVYLFLGFLLGEFEIGTEEVLGIDPRTRDTVDSHIVQKEQVGCDDGSALTHLLLCQKILLTTKPHSDGGEVIAQDNFEDLGGVLGLCLVHRAHPVY